MKKKYRHIIKLLSIVAISLILSSLVFNLLVKLPLNSQKPVDGILILGGSIKREIYAAELARQFPQIPIIISQGSEAPCIQLIFQREQAPIEQVWLEKCAQSTFDNFFFGVPLLTERNVHKVKLVTSESHLPRAKWLSQIHLGAKGIAVQVDIVEETGIPGNRESFVKTWLDVSRSIVWTVVSQFVSPHCPNVIPLREVNLSEWYQKGFECERQGHVSSVGSNEMIKPLTNLSEPQHLPTLARFH